MKLIAIGSVILMLVSLTVFSFFSFQNTAARFENQITTTYNNNRNIYDNGWKEVKEKAQVPDIYVAGLQKIYDTLIQGRQGTAGELVRFITEANPNLPETQFVQIQQSIEIFRGRFRQGQTELLAEKQAYQNYLTATYSGRFFNMFGGYPKIDMTKFDIVTSDLTEKTFTDKKADEIKLR